MIKVSVDFDGTITRAAEPYEKGFNVIRPYCKEVMDELTRRGVKFLLLTGRRPEYLQEAVSLCKKWRLPIDVSHPKEKIGSDVYIDDKNLGCTEIDWKAIYYQLLDLMEKANEKSI